jgi:hypothetical protein
VDPAFRKNDALTKEGSIGSIPKGDATFGIDALAMTLCGERGGFIAPFLHILVPAEARPDRRWE